MAAVVLPRRTHRPPSPADLNVLRRQAAGCTRCPLFARATQTVFGEGPADARIMLVGEQPGDVEDRSGEPFVGPAGRLLREVLAEAGMDATEVYLTNAVKHFKWVERGKRRIHERPNREEMLACRLWLEGEIDAVHPVAIVALGSTAAAAVIGPSVRVTRDRGRLFPSPLAPLVTVTVHPSAILRAPDSAARAEGRRRLLEDLRTVIRKLHSKRQETEGRPNLKRHRGKGKVHAPSFD